jgi:hypothetical protein
VAVLDAATLAPVATVDVPAGPIMFAGMSARWPPAGPLASRWMDAARGVVRALSTATASAFPAARARDRAASAGDDVVISDTEFSPADWAVSGAPQTTTQQLTGGNPGAWRSTNHLPSPNAVITTHLLVRPGARYDPVEQGAITSIDATWDRRRLNGVLVGERFCVEQSERLYCTWPLDLFSSADWENVNRRGLTPSSFDDGSGGQPDFSFSGAPLRFGYLRDTGGGELVQGHGIDNFVVTVHPGARNTPGRLGFDTWSVFADEMQQATIVLRRTVGTLGAVAADVRIEDPDGSVITRNVAWSDGDAAAKSIQVGFHVEGNASATARLTLVNPSGGATLDPERTEMTVSILSEELPTDLSALIGSLVALLAGVSPAWLLLLAAPAALLGWRSRNRGGCAADER